MKTRPLRIGGAVAYLRWRRGLTMSALGMRLGVPKSYVHAIEHSHRKALWLRSVVRLSAALEVSPAQLVACAASAEAAIFSERLSAALAKKMPVRFCDLPEIRQLYDVCRKAHVAARDEKKKRSCAKEESGAWPSTPFKKRA